MKLSPIHRACRIAVSVGVVLVAGCISTTGGNDVPVTDPNDPTNTLQVPPSLLETCGTICDALVSDWGVPAAQRTACVFECAGGFTAEPDACYQLVACIANRTICSGTDISAACEASAGACLADWSLANGLCRHCWEPSRTVHGKQLVTYIYATGQQVVPADFSNQAIAAILQRDDGTVYTFPGTGKSDGTYEIPNVPGCGVWIQVGSVYTLQSNQDVDTSYTFPGRDDATIGAAGTMLELDASAIQAWQATDKIEMYAPQLGHYYLGAEDIWQDGMGLFTPLTGWPAAGATSVDITTSRQNWALPDAGHDDQLYFAHFRQQAGTGTPGVTLETILEVLSTPPITMISGATTTVNGAFAAVPMATTVDINVKGSAYTPLRVDMNPAGVVVQDTSGAGVATFPGRETAWSADLLFANWSQWDADVDTGAVTFASPYLASWPRVIIFSPSWAVALMNRQGTAFHVPEYVASFTLLDTYDGSPIVPLVGPVHGLTVDGSPAFGPLSATTATPLLAWSAPVVGTPDTYTVEIDELTGMDIGDLPVVATFNTTATQVRILPGVLQAGHDYTFSVQAIVNPSASRQVWGGSNVQTSVYSP
jgi:hypothetical protein